VVPLMYHWLTAWAPPPGARMAALEAELAARETR